jgi:mono/diheme cytochrome c family protein
MKNEGIHEVPVWKFTRMQNHTASLFTKPTPLIIDLGSDRFSMFNKERDIPRHLLEERFAMMLLLRSVSAVLLILSVAQDAEGANKKRGYNGGDAGAGREVAISVCGGCHAVSEDQPFGVTGPPDFLTIANRPNLTAASLRRRIAMFMGGSSRGRMQSLQLNSAELANVVAYIMTLREH